jgi:hypothetical protein
VCVCVCIAIVELTGLEPAIRCMRCIYYACQKRRRICGKIELTGLELAIRCDSDGNI